jgi:5-methylcytosine-specific restriction protein A
MPTRPPHACGRCGQLVHAGRCSTCARAYDAQRGTPAARGYDQAWRAVRAAHLAKHPRCTACGAPAREVDHVETIRAHRTRRLDPANLRSFCKPCHSRRTAQDQHAGAAR